jgi:restriction endonuclease S subunit
MITYSIIKKSQLEGATRLDAEFYQPEYLKFDQEIKIKKNKQLRDVGEIVYGTTPKGGHFEKNGIPFVRSQNFSNLIIDKSNLVFCKKNFHDRNKKSGIKSGDILFAAVGATIGELSLVQNSFETGNINQNIARVRIFDKNIDPYFAGLFFYSKFGQFQIRRLITGNAQPYLNSDQIGMLKIPVFDIKKQKELAQYFHKIEKSNKDSEKIYQQAEGILLKELGLEDLENKDKLFSIVELSEIEEAQRFDAEYFQEKYRKLEEKIISKKYKLLEDLVSMKKGIEIGGDSYQEKGRQFIRVSSMSKLGINNNDQKFLGDKLYEKLKADFCPQEGEILLTKDATPGIAYVLKEDIKGIVSSGVLRLKVKDGGVNNEYLSLCLNSVIGQMQAERDAGGSIIKHWKPSEIGKVLIPILPQETQQKIAKLVQESHQARKESKELLEEAKRKVEEMIEN